MTNEKKHGRAGGNRHRLVQLAEHDDCPTPTFPFFEMVQIAPFACDKHPLENNWAPFTYALF